MSPVVCLFCCLGFCLCVAWVLPVGCLWVACGNRPKTGKKQSEFENRHACIYESYHGFDASRLIYFVTHDFLPVTKPQGATKARLAPKGGSLTGERVRACGCDRGGSSCRLAPPPGPSSGASRHRSMVEIWVSASCLSAWAYADAAHKNVEVHPLCATPRDMANPGHGHSG